jgi:hypothetical protein
MNGAAAIPLLFRIGAERTAPCSVVNPDGAIAAGAPGSFETLAAAPRSNPHRNPITTVDNAMTTA